MKIGVDIHGTADVYFDFFQELCRLFVEAGHEVHIVTGRRQKEIEPEIKSLGLMYTHFFSMTDYHEELGTPMSYGPWKNPWMDEETWNRTKGDYAARVGLDMMFENSDDFWPFFEIKNGYMKIMNITKESIKKPYCTCEPLPGRNLRPGSVNGLCSHCGLPGRTLYEMQQKRKK